MIKLLQPLWSSPFDFLSLVFMILAVLVGVFFPKYKVLIGALFISSLGVLSGFTIESKELFFIAWFSMSIIAVVLTACYSHSILSHAALCVVFFMGWLGILHVIPFFTNWKIFSGVHLSQDGYSYNLYFNFDKAFICGLIYFVLIPRHSVDHWGKALLRAFGIGLIAIIILYPIAISAGFIKWDPKLSFITPYWVIINLIFVCLMEEVFFRGFILDYFTKHVFSFIPKKERMIFGVVLSTVLFSVYHYRLGVGYMGLAAVAGLFYAWAYVKTRRVEVSTIPHFMINAFHFFFFTYPALK